jgi:hypothetical protein
MKAFINGTSLRDRSYTRKIDLRNEGKSANQIIMGLHYHLAQSA